MTLIICHPYGRRNIRGSSDPFAHFRQNLKNINPKVFEGYWATIELKPSIFIPQSFSIGVVVQDLADHFSFRLLTDTSKFECIYGKGLIAPIKENLKQAEATLLRANKQKILLDQINFEVDTLSISPRHFTSGDSLDSILNRLFNDMVILNPTDEENENRYFLTLDTNQVRQLVNDELKKIAGMEFEKIVVNDQHLITSDNGKTSHSLSFNLRPENKAGSVLSAVYKTASTVELNMLRASRDLATYASLKNIKDTALFVMTAKEVQYEKNEFKKMSKLIDEQSWRLETQGLKVIAFEDPQPIAKSIYEWANE
ncbi:hypothetical protein [Zwartia vadi]|uniref:hypothetical protein n=1 Tax=Zwartia vadi TaxID=3058168 RepID=UPI0025B4EF3A|nr:hypothetical protein [Zwartia vadi]MDN3988888.1 hypothetical protein [Zwartia vadi]